jgi:hypothetical protein
MAKTLPARLLRLAAAVFCSLLFVVAFGSNSSANQMNHATKVTFTSPVEVPGPNGPVVLAAGTYVFEIAGTHGSNITVQVFNQDITHLYTTILAIQCYRHTPTGTEITLVQRDGASTQQLKTWFFRDNDHGQEFVYAAPSGL